MNRSILVDKLLFAKHLARNLATQNSFLWPFSHTAIPTAIGTIMRDHC